MLSWITASWSGARRFAASILQRVRRGTLRQNLLLAVIGPLLLSAVYLVGSEVRQMYIERMPEACADDQFCIVLVKLEHDPTEQQTEHVRDSLTRAFQSATEAPVQIVVVPRVLRNQLRGDVENETRRTREEAYGWMRDLNADVLLYGRVLTPNRLLDLEFLGRHDEFRDGRRYGLDERLTLPTDFDQQLGLVIASVASELVAGAPGGRETPTHLLPTLNVLRRKLMVLLRNAPPQWSPEIRSTLLHAMGLAELGLSARSRDLNGLNRAINYLGSALQIANGSGPRQQSATLHALGIALSMRGEATASREDLDRSIVHLSRASRLRWQLNSRTLWAASEMNLATARARIGILRGDPQFIRQSLAGYQRVIASIDRVSSPEAWASVHHNAGTSLTFLGVFESKPQFLEGAVTEYRRALEERTRSGNPLGWAATLHNLGGALVSIANHRDDEAAVVEAVQILNAALQERRRSTNPREWAETQMHLGMAYRMLGILRNEVSPHITSIGHFRNVILEQTRESGPVAWAYANALLGEAEAYVARGRANRQYLGASYRHIQNALSVGRPDTSSDLWGLSNEVLGFASAIDVELCGPLAHASRAVAAFDRGLSVRGGAPLGRLGALAGRAYSRMVLYERTGDARAQAMALEDAQQASRILRTVRHHPEMSRDIARTIARLGPRRARMDCRRGAMRVRVPAPMSATWTDPMAARRWTSIRSSVPVARADLIALWPSEGFA